ncbi:MAG TPA: hypothetical protein DCP91_05760 [Eggerthellaceae bacterium]|nr:hypothetical protein [Eggerthellaceae bacterium]
MIDLDTIPTSTMDFQLGGETYTIPTLDALDADNVLMLLDKESVNRSDVIAMFRNVLETHAPGALKSMTMAQLTSLLVAWRGTGDVGESSPSSD